MRLCVWSGPRNLSTAMMYAFGAGARWPAVDEPFYAAWLHATGTVHPMQEAVLGGETDPGEVSRTLAEDGPGWRYQKHMVHHLLPDFPTDWMRDAAHVLLIRHPARVAASYAAKREAPTAADLGFEDTARVDALIAEVTGAAPVVVDTARVRADPEGQLRALCAAVGAPFDPGMLGWEAGPKPFDGPWAPHWYGAVHASTGFGGPEGPLPDLDPALQRLADGALPLYEALLARAL